MSEDDNTEITNTNDQRKFLFWTIPWYLLLLCLIVLCQSMITSGYIGSIVSSIETYYGFSSERLGIVFSSYDRTGVLSIPLISYFASKYNRAKLVAIGSFVFAIGNIIFILPYFINGYHKQIIDNSTNYFENIFLFFNNNLIEIQPLWTYYMIILSMIIMSIGASPFYTLGITYLTDHLNKDDQPIYTTMCLLLLKKINL
ncbi:unnamed protein product [Rotaria sp. Silwood2]|nr:unnamed protein product [Rotaria sp. Silwood2]CAF4314605.1 unnamed protein product [Rotaria sp. Silwood2]